MVKARAAAWGSWPFRRSLSHTRVHAQGGEHLAQFIVQFPGDGGPLLFLAGHDAAGEQPQLLLGLLQLGDVRGNAAQAVGTALLIIKGKFHRQIGMHPVLQGHPLLSPASDRFWVSTIRSLLRNWSATSGGKISWSDFP